MLFVTATKATRVRLWTEVLWEGDPHKLLEGMGNCRLCNWR